MNVIKYAKYFFLSLCLLTCANDYSVISNPEIEVIDEGPVTEVIVDYFVQPEPPENLDVLVVLDTSCSMSDNYENVSAGLDILRGDIEAITDDYQMGMINSSLEEPYFAGPIDSETSSMEIFWLRMLWEVIGTKKSLCLCTDSQRLRLAKNFSGRM